MYTIKINLKTHKDIMSESSVFTNNNQTNTQTYQINFGYTFDKLLNPNSECLMIDSTLIQFPPEMVENWWRYSGELVMK